MKLLERLLEAAVLIVEIAVLLMVAGAAGYVTFRLLCLML